MKTTIYELLGMIKDGEAPKKIMYDGYTYQFDNEYENYVRDNDLGVSINWDYVAIKCLNEPVVILDEPKENKIEKSEYQYSLIPDWKDKKDIVRIINNNFELHSKAISKLIDKLNKED